MIGVESISKFGALAGARGIKDTSVTAYIFILFVYLDSGAPFLAAYVPVNASNAGFIVFQRGDIP